MLDEFIQAIERLRQNGATMIIKWDGERSSNCCTVVVTQPSIDYVWRKDTDDLSTAVAEALRAYDAYRIQPEA